VFVFSLCFFSAQPLALLVLAVLQTVNVYLNARTPKLGTKLFLLVQAQTLWLLKLLLHYYMHRDVAADIQQAKSGNLLTEEEELALFELYASKLNLLLIYAALSLAAEFSTSLL